MSEHKLLTVRDVSLLLGVSEKEVVNLAESGAIPAYKIGGVYLRFKRDQIQQFQKSDKISLEKIHVPQKYTFNDKVSDFFYFNDFYILSVLIVILLLIIIFQGT